MDALVSRASVPLASLLSLPLLPTHAPTIVYSFGAFLGIQLLSRTLSPYLAFSKKAYTSASARTRNEWDLHVVSAAHSLIVVPLAFRLLLGLGSGGKGALSFMKADKAFATHPDYLRLSAICTGYFIWDTLVEALRGQKSLVLHGVASLSIFLCSFRPFVLYFVPVSLVYELSTPFLNAHWFLDKTGRTGTKLQLINGAVLISSFFGARIAYGMFASYDLLKTVWAVRDQIPMWLAAIYLVGNPALNVLNVFWFKKMIDALRKRFDKKQKAEDRNT